MASSPPFKNNEGEKGMKLWRADTSLWKPVEVECPKGGYPESDADGIKIYNNTHFENQKEAWENLEAEVFAGLRLAANHLDECEGALLAAKQEVVASAIRVDQFKRNREADR